MGGEPLKQKEDDNEKIKSSGCMLLKSIRLCHVASFFTIAFIQSKYR